MATTYARKDYPPIPEIRTIGVLGAGQMGSGIAEVAASAGYEVRLVDVHDDLDVRLRRPALGAADLGRQLAVAHHALEVAEVRQLELEHRRPPADRVLVVVRRGQRAAQPRPPEDP